jgi:hypothetical protein
MMLTVQEPGGPNLEARRVEWRLRAVRAATLHDMERAVSGQIP